MHIVYVVRPGDNNEELRYSLRSIAQNLPHAGVTIAGHKPPWVTNTHHCPTRQDGTKAANIRANITAACHTHPDEYLLFQDDIFITQPLNHIPHYRGRAIADIPPDTSFTRTIVTAGDILRRHGHTNPHSYDALHVPQHISTPAMLQALTIATEHTCPRILTLHGNIANRDDTERVYNAKQLTGWSRRPIVSTDDKRFRTDPVGAYLRDLFPNPCQYER